MLVRVAEARARAEAGVPGHEEGELVQRPCAPRDEQDGGRGDHGVEAGVHEFAQDAGPGPAPAAVGVAEEEVELGVEEVEQVGEREARVVPGVGAGRRPEGEDERVVGVARPRRGALGVADDLAEEGGALPARLGPGAHADFEAAAGEARRLLDAHEAPVVVAGRHAEGDVPVEAVEGRERRRGGEAEAQGGHGVCGGGPGAASKCIVSAIS